MAKVATDEFGFRAPGALGHPGRRELPEGHPTGPKVGERIPDFELPDQSGRSLSFHEDRAGAKAVLVFYRSAVW